MSTVLDVRGLGRSFGGIAAVDGVSFTVDQAEIVGIIGPNGSGKSTLFNLLTSVNQDGKIVAVGPKDAAKASMGYPLQDWSGR